MLVLETAAKMQAFSKAQRAEGKTIGFVPTMGFLHEGHLALMRKACEQADVVVLSIFVNPTQFGKNEDLDKYPRDFDRDSRMAETVGVDVIFFPQPEEIYSNGYQTHISLASLPTVLCGKSRPVHFGGVATVCCKLFNIVQPHFAVFGLKDYQQFLVVSRMVKDLNMELEIVGLPTVREDDGVAMSSRNVYLTPAQRAQAPALIESLRRAEALVAAGANDREEILAMMREFLAGQPEARIDYLELRKLPDLTDAAAKPEGEHLLAVAVYFGKTRLIDNTVLDFELAG